MFLARLELNLKPAFLPKHILALSTLFPKTKLFLLPSDPGMPNWAELYTLMDVISHALMVPLSHLSSFLLS